MKKHILLFSTALAMCLSQTQAQTIMALTSAGSLVQISNASMPAITSSPISITGVTLGQSIVGIDYRPNTGELYALGYNSILPLANAQLYVVNETTGVATAIGSGITLALGTGGIGFDFNPTVDRIRVVAENGANYRLHPTTGAVAATDGNLAYAATDPNASVTPAVAACAYTNSYIGSEATTLFDYDKTLNVTASQIPPNNGTLNTIGSSGIVVSTTGNLIGMDIYFNPTTKSNMAYLNAKVGGSNNLYQLNTSSGASSLIGTIGTGMDDIREIAVKIDRTVPSVYSGQLIYGLTKVNRNLVKFSSDQPELIRELLPITGITSGQVIVGMDVRPMDLNLYALGYHDTSRTYQLYTINTSTGTAMAVGSAGKINLGMGEKIGFDFNPTVDRIRVVSTNDSNFRMNPITGAIAATDTGFSYIMSDVNSGKNPMISSVAYTNSFKGTSSTAMFGIDDGLDAFVQIAPPNQGFVTTLVSNILDFNAADLTNDIDFFYDSVSATNIGFLAANSGSGLNDILYSISASGMLSMADTIGMGIQLYDITAQLTYTGGSTSIAEAGTQTSFVLYPNPVRNELQVKWPQPFDKSVTLLISDYTGRIFRTVDVPKSAGSININLSELAPGMYFMSSPASSETIKFVKY